MNRTVQLSVCLCLSLIAPAAPVRAQFTILHSFAGGVGDGAYPYGNSLLQSGSTLYGMTNNGGSSDSGTIFKIGADGTGFSLLRSFTGSSGSEPHGSLIQDGSTLYGMTYGGGSGGAGTIFKIGADGTGFRLLRSFTGGTSDGGNPVDSLIKSGSVLYGMSRFGGSGGNGTIFQIRTDGTGFSLLHSFEGSGSEGYIPEGSLILGGSTLYGMTTYGGDNSGGAGTIFKIGADGTGYSVLHAFTGGANDGGISFGSLIQSGSTLYGMTNRGGSSTLGTIFRIGTDGTGFSLLHSFGGFFTNGDGSFPYGSLVQSGSSLYGMTTDGGSSGRGTIFRLIIPEPASILLVAAGLFVRTRAIRRRSP